MTSSKDLGRLPDRVLKLLMPRPRLEFREAGPDVVVVTVQRPQDSGPGQPESPAGKCQDAGHAATPRSEPQAAARDSPGRPSRANRKLKGF